MATATLRRSEGNQGEPPVEDDEGESPVGDDVVFHALSNRRRRLLIRVLGDAEEPMRIGPLATRVAAREHGVEVSVVTARQRKSVYTALHQNHLPKLAEAGFVAADREWVGVRLTDRAAALGVHLEPEVTDSERQWWPVALAAAVGVAVSTLFHPGVGLPGVTAAATVAATVAVACWRIASGFYGTRDPGSKGGC